MPFAPGLPKIQKRPIDFLKTICYNYINRWEARVMPVTKYPICGMKNGNTILFSFKGKNESREGNAYEKRQKKLFFLGRH